MEGRSLQGTDGFGQEDSGHSSPTLDATPGEVCRPAPCHQSQPGAETSDCLLPWAAEGSSVCQQRGRVAGWQASALPRGDHEQLRVRQPDGGRLVTLFENMKKPRGDATDGLKEAPRPWSRAQGTC